METETLNEMNEWRLQPAENLYLILGSLVIETCTAHTYTHTQTSKSFSIFSMIWIVLNFFSLVVDAAAPVACLLYVWSDYYLNHLNPF